MKIKVRVGKRVKKQEFKSCPEIQADLQQQITELKARLDAIEQTIPFTKG